MTKLIEITGKAISGEWGNDDSDGTGIPVLRTTNFTNDGVINFNSVVTRSIAKKNLEEKYLQRGDIIIEKSGGSTDQPVGRVVYFDAEENKYLFNNFTGVLRIKDKSTWFPRYVFWALYYNYRIGGTKPYQNKTTGLHNLQTEQYICDTEIHETSYIGQKRIAAILDKVDVLISLRKKQLQKLDDLVKSRFVEKYNAGSAKSCTMRIKDYAQVLSGFAFKSNEFCSQGVPVIRISNIGDRKIIPDYGFCYKQSFWDTNSRYRAIHGDVLMAMSGATTGKAGIWKGTAPLLVNQRVAIIRAKEGRARAEFIYAITQLPWMYDLIQEKSAGCAQPNISGKQIEDMPAPKASYEEQVAFADYIAQVEETKLTVQQSLDKLELLKQSLMQKYFG